MAIITMVEDQTLYWFCPECSWEDQCFARADDQQLRMTSPAQVIAHEKKCGTRIEVTKSQWRSPVFLVD